MIVAFSRTHGDFVCRDFTMNRIITVSKENILNDLIEIDNLRIENNKVVGNKFDISRLPDYGSSHGRCYIYNVKLTSDGQAVTGYNYITSKGLVQYADKNNLVYFRKYGIVNAYIVEDKLDIKNINTLSFEKAFKPISYTSDEYYDIYKEYNNRGLITASGRVYDDRGVDGGIYKQRNYAQSKFHSFMESHKLLNQMLLRSKIINIVKIYDTMIKDGYIKPETEKANFFYKVTFIYRGEKQSLIVIRKDKKLINILKYKEALVHRTKAEDIIDLVIDSNKNEKYKSALTEKQSISNKDNNTHLKEALDNVRTLYIKKNKLIIEDTEYELRNNIMVGSADYSLLYNSIY